MISCTVISCTVPPEAQRWSRGFLVYLREVVEALPAVTAVERDPTLQLEMGPRLLEKVHEDVGEHEHEDGDGDRDEEATEAGYEHEDNDVYANAAAGSARTGAASSLVSHAAQHMLIN